jgi:hypothetical protein
LPVICPTRQVKFRFSEFQIVKCKDTPEIISLVQLAPEQGTRPSDGFMSAAYSGADMNMRMPLRVLPAGCGLPFGKPATAIGGPRASYDALQLNRERAMVQRAAEGMSAE